MDKTLTKEYVVKPEMLATAVGSGSVEVLKASERKKTSACNAGDQEKIWEKCNSQRNKLRRRCDFH